MFRFRLSLTQLEDRAVPDGGLGDPPDPGGGVPPGTGGGIIYPGDGPNGGGDSNEAPPPPGTPGGPPGP